MGLGMRGPRLGRSWEKRLGWDRACGGWRGPEAEWNADQRAWKGHSGSWRAVAEFGEARRELRDRDWIGMGRGDSSRGLGCLRPDRGGEG